MTPREATRGICLSQARNTGTGWGGRGLRGSSSSLPARPAPAAAGYTPPGTGSTTTADHHQTQGATLASLAEESPDVCSGRRSARHRQQRQPHEYSSASLTPERGDAAYCLRVPLLGASAGAEWKKRSDTWRAWWRRRRRKARPSGEASSSLPANFFLESEAWMGAKCWILLQEPPPPHLLVLTQPEWGRMKAAAAGRAQREPRLRITDHFILRQEKL